MDGLWGWMNCAVCSWKEWDACGYHEEPVMLWESTKAWWWRQKHSKKPLRWNLFVTSYFCFFPPILSWQRELDNLVEFWLEILNGLHPPELHKEFAPHLQLLWLFYIFFCPVLLQLALCPSKSGVRDVSFCAAQWLTLMCSLWVLLWCWVMLCI